jgi:3-phenylpropionate/trans-cinnamate dioxygenase ferredoxin component
LSYFFETLSLSELEEGGMITVTLQGKNILLANVEGKICATSAMCTHEEADLSQGILDGNKIVCPLHFSEFDLLTGNVMNDPARHPLEVYETKVEDGKIFVKV